MIIFFVKTKESIRNMTKENPGLEDNYHWKQFLIIEEEQRSAGLRKTI